MRAPWFGPGGLGVLRPSRTLAATGVANQAPALRIQRLPTPGKDSHPAGDFGTMDAMGQNTSLGEFLRVRRARLKPEDAGLTWHGARRVPGLRREELARLAGVSPTYYTRLE